MTNSNEIAKLDDVSIQLPAIELPTPLRGARKISTKSRYSARGYVVGRLPGRRGLAKIGYESRLEQAFLLLYLARSDVADIVEQPFTVKYIDRDGMERRNTPDFLAMLTCGLLVAVQVKTLDCAKRKATAQELALVAKSIPSHLADEVRLFTDKHFNWVDVENASQLVDCRKHVDQGADDAIVDEIAKLRGRTTISQLGRLSGLKGRSYPAIVRALYSGGLRKVSPGLIGAKTIVEKGVAS